jgi:hypothetical protein
MSTDMNETRTDQDQEPEHESVEQSEQNWSSEEDGTHLGETQFGQDGSAPAYVTAEDVEGEQPVQGLEYTNGAEAGQDGDAEADADEFPAFDELSRSETSAPEVEEPLASDDALNAGTDDSADSAEPEGVPRPENLGGHNLGAESEPLVGADAQQEFLSRWTQIQISFLEDPAGAVQSADTLIQEIGVAILASLEDRGGALATEGRAAADTEQQRLALRQYRAYLGVLLPQ